MQQQLRADSREKEVTENYWQWWLSRHLEDFPGGLAVKNLPDSAGDEGLTLMGKIPHASGQLSSCATTTEIVLYRLGAAATKACVP